MELSTMGLSKILSQNLCLFEGQCANVLPKEGCYLYDTRSSFVSLPQDKVAVISGLKEYIVVDTDDVLLICPRKEEQNIKKFIDEVKFHKGDKHI